MVFSVVAILAMLRLGTLLLALQDSDIGLHVDEAQYWHWAQSLEWGYYSKPPLIAALIAALTAVGGNGLVAVKAASWLLYPLTALTLAWLAQSLALARTNVPTRTRRTAMAAPPLAALLAATFFLTSPLAALLGLAVTTDAPLLLFWSLATALLWQTDKATSSRNTWALWALLGVVCGLGMLSKYSFAAWLPGALWWWSGQRSAPANDALPDRHGHGPILAAGLMLLMLLPHLLWSADHGWPTLQHTVDITTATAPSGDIDRTARALARVGVVLGGFWVMLGPLWLVWMFWLPAWLRRSRAAVAPSALRFIVTLHLPLALLGLVQALGSEPQINWTAPLLVGGVLWLALQLASAAPTASHWQRTALWATLTLHMMAGMAVPLAQRLWDAPAWSTLHAASGEPAAALPRRLDIWARMRGWSDAYAQLHAAAAGHLRRWPDSPVIGSSRTVITQGAYEWRDLRAHWMTWAPPGPAHNHYQLTARWIASVAGEPLLIVADGPLPKDLLMQLETPHLLAEAHAAAAGHSVVTLQLWSARSRSVDPPTHPVRLDRPA